MRSGNRRQTRCQDIFWLILFCHILLLSTPYCWAHVEIWETGGHHHKMAAIGRAWLITKWLPWSLASHKQVTEYKAEGGSECRPLQPHPCYCLLSLSIHCHCWICEQQQEAGDAGQALLGGVRQLHQAAKATILAVPPESPQLFTLLEDSSVCYMTCFAPPKMAAGVVNDTVLYPALKWDATYKSSQFVCGPVGVLFCPWSQVASWLREERRKWLALSLLTAV